MTCRTTCGKRRQLGRLLAAAGIAAVGLLGAGSLPASATSHAAPPPRQLYAVSCTAASACTAVGADGSTGGGNAMTLAERWDGTAWTVENTAQPTGSRSSYLDQVRCTSASACVAVGGYRTTGTFRNLTLAESWNGKTWAIETTPNPNGTAFSDLAGVWCTSAKACTAVGLYYGPSIPERTLAEQWNGEQWTLEPTPNRAATRGNWLSSVWCASATACTAVGASGTADGTTSKTLVEVWNGKTWAIEPSPSPTRAPNSELTGVSCLSGGACTAVGYEGDTDAGTGTTLIERWNGKTWTIEPAPNQGGARANYLKGVSCTSAKACTAVGWYSDSGGGAGTLVEVWNGQAWTIEPTPNQIRTPNSELWGVSCKSVRACMAAGLYGNTDPGPGGALSEAWNGQAWTIEPTPNPA